MESSDQSLEKVLSKELRLNDSRILKKRTNYFNTQLIKNLETISFVLIIISYLNTLSLMDFFIRLSQQLIVTKPFPKQSIDMRSMTNNMKKLISKSIFQMLIVINLLMIIFHLMFSINISGNTGVPEYSHGGWTLQIIGESKFHNWFFFKTFVLVNDILIFITHTCLYFITCLKNENLVTDDTALGDSVQQGTPEPLYDGYSGNATIVELNPLSLLKHVYSFTRERDSPETETTTNDRDDLGLSMPGGFQAFGNFSVDDFV